MLDYLSRKSWRIREYKFWIKFFFDLGFMLIFIWIALMTRDMMIKQMSCAYHDNTNYTIVNNILEHYEKYTICTCFVNQSYSSLNTYQSNISRYVVRKTTNVFDFNFNAG